MKKKKRYITPLIITIDIDKTISLAMMSEDDPFDPNDPWGKNGSNAPDYNWREGDNKPAPPSSPLINESSFIDNPFK